MENPFYIMPKLLIENKRYKHMSSNAKILYAVIYTTGMDNSGSEAGYESTVEEISERIGMTDRNIEKLFNELESYGLAERSTLSNGMTQMYLRKPKEE